MVDDNVITGKVGKDLVIQVIEEEGLLMQKIIEEKGLKQVSNEGEIEKIVDKIIAENPDALEKYKSGKTGILGFLVGQVMKETKGKANPQIVNNLFIKKLQ